jgi:sensor histidine kinase YesM
MAVRLCYQLGKVDLTNLHVRGVLVVTATTTALAIITAIGCHAYLTQQKTEIPIVPSLAYGVVMWSWWAGIAVGLWLLARWRPELLGFSVGTAAIQISVGGILSLLHIHLLQFTLRAGTYWPAWQEAYSSLNYVTLSRFGSDLIVYGFVFGISGLLHQQSQRQHDVLQKLELKHQLSEAQLKALQMQMEPHFLFNTLNALASLVAQGKNPEASKTLTHLNKILRATLERRGPEKVPFAEELHLVESYLAIQKVRFSDRLDVRIEATSEALQAMVPCFLLQPIVENAVQHGIAAKAEGGLVETKVQRLGDKLWMRVRDNGRGPGNPRTPGYGIGMRNTQERLAYFYPDAYEFAVAAPDEGGFEVTIQIPFELART